MLPMTGLLLLFSAAGTVVDLGGLKSTAPAAWKETPTTSSMRVKQFSVPGPNGDAELIVFYFGEGQGGGIEENVTRWKRMFQPPAGKTIDQVSKLETVKLANSKATVLDVSGTYLQKARPMDTEGTPRANHRMLAVVLETPKGADLSRVVGPDKTVGEQKKACDGWIKGFK